MGDNYDRASKLRIEYGDLEQAKFLLTELNKIALRIGNELGTPLFTANSRNFNIREVEVTNTNEVEVNLPKNLKGVIIKTRKIDRMKIATTSSAPVMSYGRGAYFFTFGLDLAAVKSIFITLESGSNFLEILEFT